MSSTEPLLLPDELAECLSCSGNCVPDCCGLDAFSLDPRRFDVWFAQTGAHRSRRVLAQLVEVSIGLADPERRVDGHFFNQDVDEAASRQQLIGHLELLRDVLTAELAVGDGEVVFGEDLRRCFEACETECRRACCGLAAFSREPARIHSWCRAEGRTATAAAHRQLLAVLDTVTERSRVHRSQVLHHDGRDDDRRLALVSFLVVYREAFQAHLA